MWRRELGWGRVIWGHNSGTIIRWDYSFWETMENPFIHSLPPSTCKQRRRYGATQKGAIPSPGQRPSLQHELTTLLHGGPVSKDLGKNSFFCWSQPPPYGTLVMLTQTKEHRTLIKPTYVLKQHWTRQSKGFTGPRTQLKSYYPSRHFARLQTTCAA